MRRRGLLAASLALPWAVRAQTPVRKIAVLMGVKEGDPEGKGRITATIPVVFVLAADPVGLGYIQSLGRPGGNMTGFTFFEPELVGKWFQLLKEVAPATATTSLLFNPGTAGFYYKFFEGPPGLGPHIKLAPAKDMAEVEAVLAELARTPGSSVIVGADPFNVVHGREIVALIDGYKLPS
jgi:putative ABC transport system substrate-binding protein